MLGDIFLDHHLTMSSLHLLIPFSICSLVSLRLGSQISGQVTSGVLIYVSNLSWRIDYFSIKGTLKREGGLNCLVCCNWTEQLCNVEVKRTE